VTVNAEPSATTVSVLSANQNGQSIPFTSGPFGSFVYLRADVAGKSSYGFPTGTVTFSDSFGAIPGGSTFTLNSQGNTANPNGIFTLTREPLRSPPTTAAMPALTGQRSLAVLVLRRSHSRFSPASSAPSVPVRWRSRRRGHLGRRR
jgi:hypothetical protein